MNKEERPMHFAGCNDGLTYCGCSVQNWEDSGIDPDEVTDKLEEVTCESCLKYLEMDKDEI